jgi:hypothetical protein
MKLGQIASQTFESMGIGLKCENASVWANSMRSKYSVKTYVRTNVKINIAGVEQHIETLANVWLIYAGPHLPLNAVIHIRFKLHARPW